jgi:hypothetical protein
MKTKAGKKVLKDITKDKKDILTDLRNLAIEFKNFKVIGSGKDQYLYGQLLVRAKSYKQQLENVQEFIDTAEFLESFLD